jgi:UPF0755 protein
MVFYNKIAKDDHIETPSEPNSALPRSERRSRSIVFGLVSSLLVTLFAAGLYFQHELTKPLASQRFEKIVEIRQGQSASAIARALAAQGVLKNTRVFTLFAALRGTSQRLRAGRYLCTSAMSIRDLHRMLLTGSSAEVKVTLPEGLTIEQVARRLKQKGLISDEADFRALCRSATFARSLGIDAETLEGYLYPETYFFLPGVSAEEIAKTFVSAFHDEVDTLIGSPPSYGKNKTLSPYKALILASVVEREARNQAEKPIIASVYLNRLRRRMKLECCATVRYVLDKWDAPLTMADLKTESPFNTYVHYGLPPAPICSPGKDSILAVVRPATTGYFFYCYKGDGTHYFSRTLAEHRKAVKQFLRHNVVQEQ